MSKIKLIEGTHQNQDYVQQVARKNGFKISDENQHLCVIEHVDEGKIIAVLGFSSDAGTDYINDGSDEIYLEHERLHLDPLCFISMEDFTLLDPMAEAISGWIYRYLLKSAIDAANPVGCEDGKQLFQFTYNHDVNNILHWAMDRFNHGLFKKTLDILGYQNKISV